MHRLLTSTVPGVLQNATRTAQRSENCCLAHSLAGRLAVWLGSLHSLLLCRQS